MSDGVLIPIFVSSEIIELQRRESPLMDLLVHPERYPAYEDEDDEPKLIKPSPLKLEL